MPRFLLVVALSAVDCSNTLDHVCNGNSDCSSGEACLHGSVAADESQCTTSGVCTNAGSLSGNRSAYACPASPGQCSCATHTLVTGEGSCGDLFAEPVYQSVTGSAPCAGEPDASPFDARGE